jgi:hypothetical protein
VNPELCVHHSCSPEFYPIESVINIQNTQLNTTGYGPRLESTALNNKFDSFFENCEISAVLKSPSCNLTSLEQSPRLLNKCFLSETSVFSLLKVTSELF